MKAICYSLKKFEKEYLVSANRKKHDITYISNSLGPDTARFAKGKDAVIVYSGDDLSALVLEDLVKIGVKYVATRSMGIDHIDIDAADHLGMRVANVPGYSPYAIAEHALTLMMALNRKIVKSVNQAIKFNFLGDHLNGFDFYGKTVGIIGMGKIGSAMAVIMKGLGCEVLAYDIQVSKSLSKKVGFQYTDLNTLLKQSDIITLHVPLNNSTRYMLGKEEFGKMKKGVMLINTSRGAVIKTQDLPEALRRAQIGYLGLDVYEYEKGLFFKDHSHESEHDKLLGGLMEMDNVLITPHQAFVTKEALTCIAETTILNLDKWHEGVSSPNEVKSVLGAIIYN